MALRKKHAGRKCIIQRLVDEDNMQTTLGSDPRVCCFIGLGFDERSIKGNASFILGAFER